LQQIPGHCQIDQIAGNEHAVALAKKGAKITQTHIRETSYRSINPLALELDIYSLAHHLCKMLIFYEPRRVTVGNTRHFVEE
jgi:hypothetical protein